MKTRIAIFAFFAIAPLMTLANAGQGSKSIDGWTGKFSENGVVIDIHSGQEVVYEGLTTEMNVKKLNAKSANLSIVHVASNGHSCDIEGVAAYDSATDSLTLSKPSEFEEGAMCVLKLNKKNGQIEIEDVDGNCRRDHCGARAGFGLSITLNSRVDANGKSQTTLVPRGGTNKLCFERSYGTDTLAKDKSLEVKFLRLTISSASATRPAAFDLEVVDRNSDPEASSAFSASGKCPRLADGKALCSIGTRNQRFALQNNNDGSIFLTVPRGNSLPFTELVGEGEDPSGKTFELKPLSKERIYKLTPSACAPE